MAELVNVVVVTTVLPTAAVLPLVVPVLAAVPALAVAPAPAVLRVLDALASLELLEVELPAACEAEEPEVSLAPQADRERKTALKATIGNMNRIHHVRMNEVVSLRAAL